VSIISRALDAVDFNLPALAAHIVYHIGDEIRIAAARGRAEYAVFTKIAAKIKDFRSDSESLQQTN